MTRKKRLPHVVTPEVTREVREEIEAHVQLQTDAFLAEGHDAETARSMAERQFGLREQYAREIERIENAHRRELGVRRYVDELRQDVRLSLRQLQRSPLFATAAITVMALGIAAAAAVFAVVDGALFRPLPMRAGDEVAFLYEAPNPGETSHATVAEYRAYEANATFATAVTGAYSTAFTVHANGDPEMVIGGLLTGSPREVFGLEPLAGRWMTKDEVRTSARVIMLDENYWRTRFSARADVIGSTVRVNGEPYLVVGVLPHAANLLSPGSELSLWTTLREEPWMEGEIHFMRTMARLRPDLSIASATKQAAQLGDALRAENRAHGSIEVVPARTQLVGDVRPYLLIMGIAMALLLTLVAANLANLFLARSLQRTREVAVRASLGAGRMRLLRQIMTEGMVIAFAGAALGLLLAPLLIGVTRRISTRVGALAAESVADPRLMLFTVVVAVFTALLFSAWPALSAGRLDLSAAMREGDVRSGGSRWSWRSRRALIVAEVVVAVMILCGAGLLIRSMRNVVAEAPGFNADNVLVTGVRLRGEAYDDDERASRALLGYLDRARSLPGVRSAAYASNVPMDGGDVSGGFEIIGAPPVAAGSEPFAKKRVVSPGYFETLQIPLLRGRDFTDNDRADASAVAIISKTTADRYFPGQDPIGRRITFNWGPEGELTIVGVAGDVRADGLDRAVEPTLYRPFAQFPQRGIAIVIRTTNQPLDALPQLRGLLREIDPAQALYSPQTLHDMLRESLATRRTLMVLMLSFAVVALVLASVGVYAICAQSVAARRRELGVRVALGASPAAVRNQLLRRELGVLGSALALGALITLPAGRVLSAAVYGVSARDAATLAAAVGTLFLVGLLATVIPALRITKMDVTETLRAD